MLEKNQSIDRAKEVAMQGLRTIIYPVSDLSAATVWYSQVFEVKPYFNEPFYVGFNIAGFELGLVPDGESSTAGTVAFWGCTNIDAEFARISLLGAITLEPPTDVGEGIKVAKLADPFGNCLGLIENPSFMISDVR